jgi:hypothetical protein
MTYLGADLSRMFTSYEYLECYCTKFLRLLLLYLKITFSRASADIRLGERYASGFEKCFQASPA